MSSRWLWITPRITATLSTGALTYSIELARAVARAGPDVTIVGLVAPGETPPPAEPRLHVDGVEGEPRPAWRSLVSTLPNQAVAGSVPALRRRVSELLDEDRWDVVVVDGLQAAWVARELARRSGGFVKLFVTHNHETSMRRGVAASSSGRDPRRLVLYLESVKTARAERRVLAGSDVVTSITDDDRQRFAADRPGAVHVVVRPGWSGREPADRPSIASRDRRVGIMGSFDWHVKQESLRRFVAAADPVFERHGIELSVGGRMPDAFRDEILEMTTATEVVGWVDDPADFMGRCRMGVVAEALGGGFKLKALDYLFHHLPIASLAHCAAGLPLIDQETIVLASTESALADAIVLVIDETDRLEQMAADAYEIARREFSWDGSARGVIDAVPSR